MAPRAKKWLKAFTSFAEDLRIKSKENTSSFDERGSKLVMWESQRRFMVEVGEGLDNGIHVFYCS